MPKVTNIYPANDFDHVAEKAKGELETGIIIGYDKEGRLTIFSGGLIDGRQPTVKDWLFMIESFKAKMMNGDYL